jgi:membrane-associated phospholipid phosphatase
MLATGEPVASAGMDEKVLALGDDPAEPPPTSPAPSMVGEPAIGVGTADAGPARRGLSWLLPGGLLLILVLLTVNVLAHGPLIGVDERIRSAVQAQATSPAWRWLSDRWYSPAQLIVDLGNYQVAVPILAACALFATARCRTPRPLVAAVAGVVLLLTTVTAGKILIGRTGPGLTTLGAGGLGVFPSGHTTTATVCLGLAVALLVPARPAPPGLPARRGRIAVAAVAVVCLLVGAALVWCDDHWFTDVVAGWALAGLVIQAAEILPRLPLPRWARGRG